MNISDWISSTTCKLEATSSTSRLDAELLIARILNRERSWVLAHPEFVLQNQILQKLDRVLRRRMNSEPIAYIVGRSEFYGREFEVSADTLQPRPETETIIELLLDGRSKVEGGNTLNIVDVGTGSGCLAITAYLELARSKIESGKWKVYATDISDRALKVARRNRLKHKSEIDFYEGNLLEPIIPLLKTEDSEVLIVANLPYVPDSHTINEAARHEPDIAIFGGVDGLEWYRQLFEQITLIESTAPIRVYTESLPPQHNGLRAIAQAHGFTQTAERDFIQAFESTR